MVDIKVACGENTSKYSDFSLVGQVIIQDAYHKQEGGFTER